MNSNLKKFYTFDKEKAFEEGVKYIFDEGVYFVLRYFNPQSPKMKAAMLKYYKPYARQIEMRTMSEDLGNELAYRTFFDVSVKDWKGIEVDGKLLEVSQDNFVNLMKDLCSDNVQAYLDMKAFAEDIQNYKLEETGSKEDLGNS